MAEHHSTSAPAAPLEAARDRTVFEAATEAGALATIFRQSFGDDGRMPVEFQCAIRGALLRIEELCASVCALQREDWRDVLANERSIVFGEPQEAAHV
jgi:hypothetical protein